MKIRPCFIRTNDLQAGRVIYAPAGTLFDRVVLRWEDNDRPFPWLNEPEYVYDTDGTYTLGEGQYGGWFMIWKPKVIVRTGDHLKRKEIEIIFPQEQEEGKEYTEEGEKVEGEEFMPIVEQEIRLDPAEERVPFEEEEEEGEEQPLAKRNPEEEKNEEEEEKKEEGEGGGDGDVEGPGEDNPPKPGNWDGTAGYNEVIINLKYNKETFPVKWKEVKEIKESIELNENPYQYYVEWYKEPEELEEIGERKIPEYYRGIDMEVDMKIKITRIQNIPTETFTYSATGLQRLERGETGIWLRKEGEEAGEGEGEWVIIAHHRPLEGELQAEFAFPDSWIARGLNLEQEGRMVTLGNGVYGGNVMIFGGDPEIERQRDEQWRLRLSMKWFTFALPKINPE